MRRLTIGPVRLQRAIVERYSLPHKGSPIGHRERSGLLPAPFDTANAPRLEGTAASRNWLLGIQQLAGNRAVQALVGLNRIVGPTTLPPKARAAPKPLLVQRQLVRATGAAFQGFLYYEDTRAADTLFEPQAIGTDLTGTYLDNGGTVVSYNSSTAQYTRNDKWWDPVTKREFWSAGSNQYLAVDGSGLYTYDGTHYQPSKTAVPDSTATSSTVPHIYGPAGYNPPPSAPPAPSPAPAPYLADLKYYPYGASYGASYPTYSAAPSPAPAPAPGLDPVAAAKFLQEEQATNFVLAKAFIGSYKHSAIPTAWKILEAWNLVHSDQPIQPSDVDLDVSTKEADIAAYEAAVSHKGPSAAFTVSTSKSYKGLPTGPTVSLPSDEEVERNLDAYWRGKGSEMGGAATGRKRGKHGEESEELEFALRAFRFARSAHWFRQTDLPNHLIFHNYPGSGQYQMAVWDWTEGAMVTFYPITRRDVFAYLQSKGYRGLRT